jgi:hypothetical protein
MESEIYGTFHVKINSTWPTGRTDPGVPSGEDVVGIYDGLCMSATTAELLILCIINVLPHF